MSKLLKLMIPITAIAVIAVCSLNTTNPVKAEIDVGLNVNATLVMSVTNCDSSDSDTLNLDITPTTPTNFVSNCQIVEIGTNAPGYELSIKAVSKEDGSNSLVYQNPLPSSLSIPPTVPATSSPLNTPNILSTDSWGFALTSANLDLASDPSAIDITNFDSTYTLNDENGNYSEFPNTETTIWQSEDLPGQIDNFTFYYATNVSYAMLAGLYQTTVTYTAIANDIPEPPTVDEVIIDTPNQVDTVIIGQSLQLSALVLGENNPSQEVTWSIVETTAPNTTIDPTGLLTIDQNETLTTITVKATSIEDPNKYATMTITIQYYLAQVVSKYNITIMQLMSNTHCQEAIWDSSTNATTANSNNIVTLIDARDNRSYKVKKMPDNKCWMYENLHYIGGGTNTYGDVVTTGTSGANVLIQLTNIVGNATGGTVWNTTTGTTTRLWTSTSYNNLTLYSGTRCSGSTTGTSPMDSICGDQILYNWCAAIGLDSSTTPTCAAATNTGTGTGYVGSTDGTGMGVIGKAGGKGGESKGNNQAANQSGVNSSTVGSICPAGWRLPSGRVGTANTATSNLMNEWNILNESFFIGTLFTNTSSTTINSTVALRAGYWQPNGTLPSGGAGTPSAFGTVPAGGFYPGFGLYLQSTLGYWWTSSLNSATNTTLTVVDSTGINPTSNSNKGYGFAVRCVL